VPIPTLPSDSAEHDPDDLLVERVGLDHVAAGVADAARRDVLEALVVAQKAGAVRPVASPRVNRKHDTGHGEDEQDFGKAYLAEPQGLTSGVKRQRAPGKSELDHGR
jgi:hypothetical protein